MTTFEISAVLNNIRISTMRFTGLFALAIALAGCAPMMQWQRDGTSQAQFEEDRRTCEFEAIKAVQTSDPYMQSLFGQELDKANRRKEVGIACMRAKGYDLAPIARNQVTEPKGCAKFEQLSETEWRRQYEPCSK